ncbi:MAG: hypothetical protein ACM3O9_01505 [Methylocystaceae bacterium]
MKIAVTRKNIVAALGVAAFSFVVAIVVSMGSEVVVRAVSSLWLSFLFLFFVILVGVLGDMVGTAAMGSQTAPLNAKASSKVFGARQAVKLSKNADKVAVFCSDIIGDVSGTVSGAIGASIVLSITKVVKPSPGEALLIGAGMTSLIAAIMIGGKALGKSIALTEANEILFWVARILAWWEDTTGWAILEKRR